MKEVGLPILELWGWVMCLLTNSDCDRISEVRLEGGACICLIDQWQQRVYRSLKM